MEYPTHERHLLLPEYGRNVQHMVDYALTLQDRAERNRCATAIVRAMEQLHPERKGAEQKQTYYDHLALMSGFRLDIDYPFGNPQPEELHLLPAHLQYTTGTFAFRHYGRIVQAFVAEACREQDPARRNALVVRIANRLKFSYLVWNKDQVDDRQIVADIERLSRGQLNCDFPGFYLMDASKFPKIEEKTGKKKKKK